MSKDIVKLKVQEEGDNKRISLILVLRRWPRLIVMTLALAVLVLVLLLAQQLAPTMGALLLKMLTLVL